MTESVPEFAKLVAPREQLHFLDCQSVALPDAMTAIAAWNLVMSISLPGMALAFKVRDAVSSRFGVKRIGGFSGRTAEQPKPGDRLDFFLVEEASENRLVLTERDRHLDVMTCVTTHDQRLTITSSVLIHNWFGRAYMIPIGPAHRLIVSVMLRRAQATLRRRQLQT